MPTCWIVAGPNGAGKTTFALRYLPAVVGCSRFINADLIAAGLSPLASDRKLVAASRLFLTEIEAAVAARADVAFETTLAGRRHLRLVRHLRASGWRVELIYLALPGVEMSRLRVAERVAHGGHGIPDAGIVRRFPRSLHNLLHVFAWEADRVQCLMNTGTRPEPIFEQSGAHRLVQDAAWMSSLLERVETVSQRHDTAKDLELTSDFKATLECLREAVAEALERKRRLGHYSVQWINGRPQLIGEDAPAQERDLQ